MLKWPAVQLWADFETNPLGSVLLVLIAIVLALALIARLQPHPPRWMLRLWPAAYVFALIVFALVLCERARAFYGSPSAKSSTIFEKAS